MGLPIAGKACKKKIRTEQLSLANGKVIELKLIKHDEELYEPKKI